MEPTTINQYIFVSGMITGMFCMFFGQLLGTIITEFFTWLKHKK